MGSHSVYYMVGLAITVLSITNKLISASYETKYTAALSCGASFTMIIKAASYLGEEALYHSVDVPHKDNSFNSAKCHDKGQSEKSIDSAYLFSLKTSSAAIFRDFVLATLRIFVRKIKFLPKVRTVFIALYIKPAGWQSRDSRLLLRKACDTFFFTASEQV